MAFSVNRIDHVVLRVRDKPAMVRFYQEALGFRVERTLERISLVQLRAGASLLDMVPQTGSSSAPNMDHLCFRVEPFDRDAIVNRLAPFGISIGETVPRTGWFQRNRASQVERRPVLRLSNG